MENQDETSPAEELSHEFFPSATSTTSTHEEWLLRLCSQLMHREASVISIMEANLRHNKKKKPWRNSSRASRGSNNASTATEPETSEVS